MYAPYANAKNNMIHWYVSNGTSFGGGSSKPPGPSGLSIPSGSSKNWALTCTINIRHINTSKKIFLLCFLMILIQSLNTIGFEYSLFCFYFSFAGYFAFPIRRLISLFLFMLNIVYTQ